MTTVWITAKPHPMSPWQIRAFRDAVQALNTADSVTLEQAIEILKQDVPFCIGAAGEADVVADAVALLPPGFEHELNLQPEVEPEAGGPAAHLALICMKLAEGRPLSALSIAAEFHNVTGDVAFFDAGILISQTFDGHAQLATIKEMAGALNEQD